ncbi:hypothetical protein Hanom_Chr00s004049g01718721 [Helianthus anomalus]
MIWSENPQSPSHHNQLGRGWSVAVGGGVVWQVKSSGWWLYSIWWWCGVDGGGVGDGGGGGVDNGGGVGETDVRRM